MTLLPCLFINEIYMKKKTVVTQRERPKFQVLNFPGVPEPPAKNLKCSEQPGIGFSTAENCISAY